jgi:hypothetical protein
MGADRIHPDVPSNVVRRIIAAKDVVVEFFLPKRTSCFPFKWHGGFVFYRSHELKHIAGKIESLEEQMDVIRHEAISMDDEKV